MTFRPHALPTLRYAVPDPVTGYHLDPAAGFFSAILPLGVDRTNIVTNPSFETNTTGWAGTPYSISTLARVATKQRRGAYSLQVTPLTGDNGGGVYYLVALTAATQYSLSLDFWGQAGLVYVLQVTTTAPANVGTIKFVVITGKSVWERVSIIGTVPATTNYWFALTKQTGNATVTPFYIDGAQIEAGLLTTYIDGDQKGFVRGRADYYWNGTPHASSSVRLGQSRAGGTLVSFSDLGFRLLSIVGLGLGGIINQMTPLTRGGAYYGGTVIADRQFTLVGQIDSPGGLQGLARIRQAFIDLFKPDVVTPDQPMVLRYQSSDDCGNALGPWQDIVCVSEGDPLVMRMDNLNSERLGLTFRLYFPFVAQEVGNAGATLAFQQTFTPNYIAQRSAAGAWSAMGTGANGAVNVVVAGPDGKVYAGGAFAAMDGVANTSEIAVWDPVTQTWAALGTGGAGGAVYSITFAPDGTMIATGTFTSMGGVANTKYIAKWNGSAWVSISSGVTGSEILSSAYDNLGNLFATGTFTVINGVAAVNIAYMTPAGVWTAIGTGINNTGRVIKLGPDGAMYVGGNLTTANGSNVYELAKITFPLGVVTIAALGTGPGDRTANTTVRDMIWRPDGTLWVAVTYNQLGFTFGHIRVWNGVAWDFLYPDQNYLMVWALDQTPNGIVMAGGLFGNTVTPPYLTTLTTTPYQQWAGTWVMPDLSPQVTTVQDLLATPDGRLYIAFDTAGTNSTSGVPTTVTNLGSASAGPKLVFTGPGQVKQIRNYTNGKSIYFNLTLLAGETAVLDLTDPSNITFVSSFRGSIISTIVPGSQAADFVLAPGANSIALFIDITTTAATAANIQFRNTSHSIDNRVGASLLP